LLSLDPLPQLVTLWNALSKFGEALLSFQAVFRHPLPFSKPIFYHKTLHTGSTSEQLTPLEALYKCLNTIQKS